MDVPGNVRLEPSETITRSQLDAGRNDFEKTFTGSTSSTNANTNPIEREYRSSEPSAVPAIRNFFDAYVSSRKIRSIIDRRKFTELVDKPVLPCYRATDRRVQPELKKGRLLNNRNFRLV